MLDRYYVHYNGSWVGVKEEVYFNSCKRGDPKWAASGALCWHGPIVATDTEEARKIGEKLVADGLLTPEGYKPPKPLTKWVPTTDLMTLRRMGKLAEECSELQCVAARVVIHGIDEVDPGTGKVNRARLIAELADVQAQIECTIHAFGLDAKAIAQRTAEKMRQMNEWEAMFASAATAPTPLGVSPINPMVSGRGGERNG